MLNERKLTKSELAKREDIIMKMKKNKRQLVKKYGKDAEAVMYGRATKLAKKQAEAMDQDRIKEMVKAALMNPMKEDQVEEGNAFIVAADAARDAGKKEFEFPEGSGKMHPVKIKADIDEVDNSEYAMAVRASKAYKPGPKPSPKRFPKPKDASDLRKLDALEKRRAQIMRDMEQEAEMEGGPIADRYGDMLNKIDAAIAKLSGQGKGDEYMSKDEIERRAAMLDLEEDLDLGHQDNEPHMLKADLYRIGKYAMELYQMVDRFEEGSEEVDFPHWWQSKVIKAKDMLVSAKHYLDFEIKEPQIDAMVDVVQDVEAIDEFDDKSMKAYGDAVKKAYGVKDKKDKKPVKEGTWSLGTSKQIKDAIHSLEMLQIADAASIADSLEADNKFYYNVIGDDIFHDAIDRAEREAGMGNIDRAQNGLADAIGRAEELLAFVQKRESSRPYPTDSIFEEEAGEGDKVASDIQKAMNAAKGDEAKTHQLKKARIAMNKGDLEKAKKIASRIAKQLKSK